MIGKPGLFLQETILIYFILRGHSTICLLIQQHITILVNANKFYFLFKHKPLFSSEVPLEV